MKAKSLGLPALVPLSGLRVLLIEDDSATAQSIELMLKSDGFNVFTTDLGKEGVDLGTLYAYHIIVLDLNLPDMSGFEVLRSLRVSKVKTPILILSGNAGMEDKVKGLGLGAETVEINHVHVHLTGKEYEMLELLSLRKAMTVSKEMFLTQLYGGMDEPEIQIIDVFICKLRKKLANASNGKDYIETIWGRGYLLREPGEDKVATYAKATALGFSVVIHRRR